MAMYMSINAICRATGRGDHSSVSATHGFTGLAYANAAVASGSVRNILESFGALADWEVGFMSQGLA